MPKIQYIEKKFRGESEEIIASATEILEEYAGQGYDLTLRQLYYQFVARTLLPNTQQAYKRLGSIINDARLAGLIDWDMITDRTRNLESLSHWSNPGGIISSAAWSYHIDMWETQDAYVEVWIEKDALVGVIEQVCNTWDTPYFSCRGYTSQSEMWRAATRFKLKCGHRRGVLVHLSDHDPSGLDMAHDIQNRFDIFGADVTFTRVALTIDQIGQYGPPPNPAKVTDSRYDAYVVEYGDESWELDALEPWVIEKLVRDEISKCVDQYEWDLQQARKDEDKSLLSKCSKRWDEVVEFLKRKEG